MVGLAVDAVDVVGRARVEGRGKEVRAKVARGRFALLREKISLGKGEEKEGRDGALSERKLKERWWSNEYAFLSCW